MTHTRQTTLQTQVVVGRDQEDMKELLVHSLLFFFLLTLSFLFL
jgi:hypothetical protein